MPLGCLYGFIKVLNSNVFHREPKGVVDSNTMLVLNVSLTTCEIADYLYLVSELLECVKITTHEMLQAKFVVEFQNETCCNGSSKCELTLENNISRFKALNKQCLSNI